MVLELRNNEKRVKVFFLHRLTGPRKGFMWKRGGEFDIENLLGKSLQNWRESLGNFIRSMSYMDKRQNECRHLQNMIEKQVSNNRLQQYVRSSITVRQTIVVSQTQPPTTADDSGRNGGNGHRVVILWLRWIRTRFTFHFVLFLL